MYSLHLDIVKRVEWDIDSSMCLDPFFEVKFILPLNLFELTHKASISCEVGDSLKVIEVCDPVVKLTYSVAEEL